MKVDLKTPRCRILSGDDVSNPVLKKLSQPGLSGAEIANLIEKHIGDGTNEYHCKEACDALIRIKDESVSLPARFLVMTHARAKTYCEIARHIISEIRGEK